MAQVINSYSSNLPDTFEIVLSIGEIKAIRRAVVFFDSYYAPSPTSPPITRKQLKETLDWCIKKANPDGHNQ